MNQPELVLPAGTDLEGDPDFVATTGTGVMVVAGEAKTRNQIHTRTKDQYYRNLSSTDSRARNRVAKTAAQEVMYMVSNLKLPKLDTICQESLRK